MTYIICIDHFFLFPVRKIVLENSFECQKKNIQISHRNILYSLALASQSHNHIPSPVVCQTAHLASSNNIIILRNKYSNNKKNRQKNARSFKLPLKFHIIIIIGNTSLNCCIISSTFKVWHQNG